MKKKIIHEAWLIARENLTINEFMYFFNLGYPTALAYIEGRKVIPLKLAFRILDHFHCSLNISISHGL